MDGSVQVTLQREGRKALQVVYGGWFTAIWSLQSVRDRQFLRMCELRSGQNQVVVCWFGWFFLVPRAGLDCINCCLIQKPLQTQDNLF